MTDKRLDDAIDRTVRDLMNVEPHPGLTRRVMSQLQPAQTPFLRMPRLAVALALTAAVVIAVIWIASTPSRAPEVQRVESMAHDAQPQVSTSAAPADGPTRVPLPAIRDLPRARTRGGRATAALAPFVSDVTIRPLGSIDPIALDPVRTRAIHTPHITIAPLEMAQLRLEPLTSAPQ